MRSQKLEAFLQFAQKHYNITLDKRLEILKQIKNWLSANVVLVTAALEKDLDKSYAEALVSEIHIVSRELKNFLKHLKIWCKPQRMKSGGITTFFSKFYTYYQPLGVSLIIAPFNYPFQLIMLPLIGSIAAGNYSVIKNSFHVFHTDQVVQKMITDLKLERYIFVLDANGPYSEVQEVIDKKPNILFFTGSQAVGYLLQKQAAAHNIKTILELGSAAPVIIDKNTDITKAAKLLSWAKTLNAGQTCMSPNTVYVVKELYESLIKEIEVNFKIHLGPHPLVNKDYPKIISQSHIQLLVEKIAPFKKLQFNLKTQKIHPAMVTLPTTSSLVGWETFGPILFIVKVNSFEQAFALVQQHHPEPLAAYYFGHNQSHMNKLMHDIKSGNWTFNEFILHSTNLHIPFGGSGASGHGRYRGKFSLEAFSNICTIMKSRGWDSSLRYPPYKEKMNKIAKLFKL